MKKVGILSLLLILSVVTIIANNPLASVPKDVNSNETRLASQPNDRNPPQEDEILEDEILDIELLENELLENEVRDNEVLATPDHDFPPIETKETRALIPSPLLMLLIGSGLVGLIICRKKYITKD